MTYFNQENYNIYDSLPCCAVVFDKELDIIYSNKMYKKQFGGSEIKVDEQDRDELDKALASASEPVSIDICLSDSNGKLVDVRAFAVKTLDNNVFAILIDNKESAEAIRSLRHACARYATAIRGTDEIFYEYIKSTDTLTILFPTKDGTMETTEIAGFFANIGNIDFILEEDLPILKELEDNVKIEKTFEFRMKLRDSADYEWYAVAVKPDKENTGMFVGSARNIQGIKVQQEHLKEKALIDPLSKVYNRAAAVDRITDSLQMRLSDCECALIVLDIDNFKKINDTFGHLYGDAVIAMAAGSIKSTLDAGDIMGRFGGDEFFVFIDNAEKTDLEKKLENIRQAVLKMRLDANDENDISCSIGVATGKGGDEYEVLFRQADSALYKAKKNGKNRFEYFDGEYSEEEALSYAGTKDEHESNEEHNIVTMALEIASKSTSPENAIINIMRHAGISLNLDFIQTMKYDMAEDKVSLMYQWLREHNGEYNVVITHKKSGYYAHNDLVLFKNKFQKDKLFRQTIEFEEGFSPKYQDVFKSTRHVNYIHASNTANENTFYEVTFQSLNQEREWTEQDMRDMMEITKILSMYFKSTDVETEKEKMLLQKLDYDPSGIYTLMKFYDEAGRMSREATAEGGRLGVIHFDVKDLCGFNFTHGGNIGDKVIDGFVKKLLEADAQKAVSCRIFGTDIFITHFHTTIEDDNEIAKIIEEELEKFCEQFAEFQNPRLIIKAGLKLYPIGWRLGNMIDMAVYAKKYKEIDRSRCFVSEIE